MVVGESRAEKRLVSPLYVRYEKIVSENCSDEHLPFVPSSLDLT